MRRTPDVIVALLLVGSVACVDDARPRTPTSPDVAAAPLADRGPGSDALAATTIGPSPLLAPEPIGVRAVATGLVSPVQLVAAPGEDKLRFIVDQIGLIRVLNARGELQAQPFLDVRGKLPPLNARYDERGLLSLAFHPRFTDNGRFVVFYNTPPRAGAPAGYNNEVVISEFRVMGDPSRLDKLAESGVPVLADPSSERVILQVDHPQANHNGGTAAFGPDGYLYVSIGDGGNANDVGLGHVEDWYAVNAGGNGQDITSNLLGNILRIDVDHGSPYTVPADNPFVGRPGLDEIYAYGFRNPYRFSFDRGGSHMLLSMDAGQELWEEVSNVVKGGNYGWNVKEGTHCFSTANPRVSLPSCPTMDPTTGAPLRDPVIEFANAKQPGGLSLTVVGGNVYRGQQLPWLRGRYVFGGATSSFAGASGRLFVATPTGMGLWPMAELLVEGTQPLGYVVKGFGEDARGEIYVMASLVLGPSGTTGTVLQLVKPHGQPPFVGDDDHDDDDR